MHYTILSSLLFILRGAVSTIEIVVCVMLISLPVALLIALAQLRGSRIVEMSLVVLGAIMRGLPPLVILFMCYFMSPLLELSLSPFVSAVVALSLYIVFYFSECFRSGLLAIQQGQYEAITAMGFTPFHAFRRILFPQIIPNLMPTLSGYVTEVIKTSSLASTISVMELTSNGYQMMMSSGRPFTILAIVGALYAFLDVVSAYPQRMIVRHFSARSSS